ncbi:MAG: alpha/beta fold hydrolase [Candidatus Competibacterales bacterium]|nr:alpha/beta fold hydrolase [Candidatus Competibacterales bacterium]
MNRVYPDPGSGNRPRPRTVLPGLVAGLLLLLAAFPGSISVAEDPGSRVFSFTQMVPQLGREKWVWVYLPPAYAREPGRRFPVLYMQDGQDLFESALAVTGNAYMDESLGRELRRQLDWYGSWRLDRRLDQLFGRQAADGIIIVGISSGEGNRTAEYSPWPWRAAPYPEGDPYVDFIVGTLKPYIDRQYRTLGGRAFTGIAGSSMGGVIALYAALRHPEIFSRVAALSPVLTPGVFGRPLVDYIRRQDRAGHRLGPMRIYVDLGSAEPGFGPIEPVRDALRGAGFDAEELWFRRIPDGEHRITHWGARFPEVLQWLYPPPARGY